MDKKQAAIEVGFPWILSGLSGLLFAYFLRGARSGEIDIGRIGRHPDVEGYLHGSSAWLTTWCAFALWLSLLSLALVVSLMAFKNTKPTKLHGWVIVCSLLILVCASVVGAVVTYTTAVPAH